MAANIGCNEGMARASKTVLKNLLSDHFVLLAKTWNYHWNVKGVKFPCWIRQVIHGRFV